jgi:hypothetical protein
MKKMQSNRPSCATLVAIVSSLEILAGARFQARACGLRRRFAHVGVTRRK